MPYVVFLHPPNHSHHKNKNIKKERVFLNLQMKNIIKDQGVGYQWAASEHIGKGSMGAS